MGLDNGPEGKWSETRASMPALRENMSKWQTALEGAAWNSLYWNNHDQPRVVSRFGDDRPAYRVLSAKLLATCLHLQKGTPYIYQGEELGMTNANFAALSDYRDIESIGQYEALTKAGRIAPETMLHYLRLKSRDNARTPMQWSDAPGAGFTTGTPWIALNRNFTEINAAAQTDDPDSVWTYYKKLIALRAGSEILKYGEFKPAGSRGGVIAYQRILGDETRTVLLNFSRKPAKTAFLAKTAAESVLAKSFRSVGSSRSSTVLSENSIAIVISNTNRTELTGTLLPYEALVLKE
jgi:oligo-1,6-glucosidase